MAFAIHQAALGDLDELTALFDQYRQFQGQPGDRPACQSFLQDRLRRGESVIFMARSESLGAIGFAQLYPSFSSTALKRVFILNDLFVADAGRRNGTASALLAAAERYAWCNSACRITLNVMQSNLPAQHLYEARGWTRDREFFMYHRFPPVV